MTILTRTAILEPFTPAAADAVSGVPGAGERIGMIAGRNMLIQEIGVAEPAFRYHHLLRSFLLAELLRREPGESAALHHRAAEWHAAAGHLDRAISHALASGHERDAARYLTEAALGLFYTQPATLDRWLRELDAGIYMSYPPLAVVAGWIHLFNGRADDADRMVEIAERSTFAGIPGDGSSSFASQKAIIVAMMGRHGPEDMLRNAQLATSLEGPGQRWRATALLVLGLAYLAHGDLDRAAAAFAEPTESEQSTGWAVREAMRASVAMVNDDWDAAATAARASLDFVTAAHYGEIAVSLITYATAARVAIHARDLAAARDLLVRAQRVRPLVSHGLPLLAVVSLLEVARAYLGLSDPAGAQLAVREAEHITRRRPTIGRLTADLLEMRQQVASATSILAGSSTLTAAELRVLWLMPTYLGFQEIAERLFISRNTVKTHSVSIYGKLQVSSRGEAVERAVELGLLEPYPGLGPRRSDRPADPRPGATRVAAHGGPALSPSSPPAGRPVAPPRRGDVG
jgi:LuxR family maltose regulon positive regulatory protein